MNCPICDTPLSTGAFCKTCGFDISCDYERYGSVSRPKTVPASIAARRAAWQGRHSAEASVDDLAQYEQMLEEALEELDRERYSKHPKKQAAKKSSRKSGSLIIGVILVGIFAVIISFSRDEHRGTASVEASAVEASQTELAAADEALTAAAHFNSDRELVYTSCCYYNDGAWKTYDFSETRE